MDKTKGYHAPKSSSKEFEADTKTPPLFQGEPNIDPELQPFNTARWEEPLTGPEGQQPGKYVPGDLINEASLFRQPGPAEGLGEGGKAPWEPEQPKTPLRDSDFPNKGVGFTKGTEHNLDYGAK